MNFASSSMLIAIGVIFAAPAEGGALAGELDKEHRQQEKAATLSVSAKASDEKSLAGCDHLFVNSQALTPSGSFQCDPDQ
jgi:hypothetical protein